MDRISLIHSGNEFEFEIADANGYRYKAGLDHGIRPMQSVLGALASCSAVDIIMILQKKKISFKYLLIDVTGEREENTTPALWKTINMQVRMITNADKDVIEKVISLSIDKYCSVAETLRRAGASITWTFKN